MRQALLRLHAVRVDKQRAYASPLEDAADQLFHLRDQDDCGGGEVAVQAVAEAAGPEVLVSWRHEGGLDADALQEAQAVPAHREVARLLDAGILSERQVGRTRLISANGDSPLVDPLREILRIATGPVVVLAEELARIDGIGAAFLYAPFAARRLGDAGPAPHDIDVVVLGEPDVEAVFEACTRVEAAVHRSVNPTILTRQEFAAPSGFLDGVRSRPAVAVIGEPPWH